MLLRNILSSYLTEQRGLQTNKNTKPSAAPFPYTHRHSLMSFTLLSVCGWQYRRSLFLQAVGQRGAAFVYFVPCPHFSNRLSYPFLLSPHFFFFCMRSLCTGSLSLYFSLPCWFICDMQCPLCAVLAPGYPPRCENQHPGCRWRFLSSDSDDLFFILLAALASYFFTFLTAGTCAKQTFIGTKYHLKLAHK